MYMTMQPNSRSFGSYYSFPRKYKKSHIDSKTILHGYVD
ncbi:hypothetical protein TREVI0001_2184 [Treponema vincentii ATCC 35580]|uniref:Uncharacterized protein n=1 Tax=Treponema vincentii ATCC 35580 TaxID=596324 RepID=C8PPR4_9SPIR|nr:hypothetical protein TREVI0001_2184 [Treponema vincentii ATCC 35580]